MTNVFLAIVLLAVTSSVAAVRRVVSAGIRGQIFCFAVGAVICLRASAPLAAEPSFERAFTIIEQAVASEKIPGAAVLIMKDGNTLGSRAFGSCDLQENRPFRVDTICWIASITKPVTATAAMTLVDRGLLRLDDPVSKYLPAFRDQTDRNGNHYSIRIRQLMSHSSGIQSSVPLRPRFFFQQPWYRRSLVEVAHAIAGTKLIFKPGTRVQYSNSAPYVLGRIIEIQSGRPFGVYVTEQILDPLGMTDTGFAITADKMDRSAVVYRRQGDSRVVYCRFDPSWNVRMTMPDGGLFSTPADIARLANSFLGRGPQILSKKSVDAMLTEQAGKYGFGWILDGHGQFSHWGSSGTLVWADRSSNVVGVVFFQIQDQSRIDSIQKRFREAVTRLSRDI